jgi:50S ribosomal protein L16 3-hydroxylase
MIQVHAKAGRSSHNARMTSRPTSPRAAKGAVAQPVAPAKVEAQAVQAAHLPIDVDQATALLGGLSPTQFMRKHWQKKPLLIRQAVPGITSPIDRVSLFDLAAQEEVESRLIVHKLVAAPIKPATAAKTTKSASGKVAAAASDWTLEHGPLNRRSLPPLKQGGWTLLVQGLDLHVPAAHDLLQRFRFVPEARLDDLMISYATDGGGVGPHYDSYDVFLLQVHGTRRWRVGPLKDDRLESGVPLKILSHFEPEQEYVLEPGDMLYLPPRWAHDGIAQGECITCSIGFRVPDATELAKEVLVRWIEGMEDAPKRRLYEDPRQPAVTEAGLIPKDLQKFTTEAIERLLKDSAGMQSALGEILTEPKPRVWFEGGDVLPDGVGVRLDPRTRMLYDAERIFANGESWRAAGKDAKHLRHLADRRGLSAKAVALVSVDVRELLNQWAEDGWLHPAP